MRCELNSSGSLLSDDGSLMPNTASSISRSIFETIDTFRWETSKTANSACEMKYSNFSPACSKKEKAPVEQSTSEAVWPSISLPTPRRVGSRRHQGQFSLVAFMHILLLGHHSSPLAFWTHEAERGLTAQEPVYLLTNTFKKKSGIMAPGKQGDQSSVLLLRNQKTKHECCRQVHGDCSM